MKDKHGMEEPYQCPECGSYDADPNYPGCWHCSKCSFARCEYENRSENKDIDYNA